MAALPPSPDPSFEKRQAMALLRAHPRLAGRDAFTAAAAGDPGALARCGGSSSRHRLDPASSSAWCASRHR